jgi:hypothetical protein
MTILLVVRHARDQILVSLYQRIWKSATHRSYSMLRLFGSNSQTEIYLELIEHVGRPQRPITTFFGKFKEQITDCRTVKCTRVQEGRKGHR